jgi:hypothetical protein
MGDIFDQAAKLKQPPTGDIFDQAAVAIPPAPNAGLAPPAGGAKPSTILNAPEESGLETGPLHSHNPAENNSLTHGGESARFLARAAHSAGQALNPLEVIPSIYHAAVDKPQDSQQAMEEQAATAPNIPPAISRLVYRSTVKPVTNAIQDYAAGRVTPEAAMNISPEALGGAAGTVVGAKPSSRFLVPLVLRAGHYCPLQKKLERALRLSKPLQKVPPLRQTCPGRSRRKQHSTAKRAELCRR